MKIPRNLQVEYPKVAPHQLAYLIHRLILNGFSIKHLGVSELTRADPPVIISYSIVGFKETDPLDLDLTEEENRENLDHKAMPPEASH